VPKVGQTPVSAELATAPKTDCELSQFILVALCLLAAIPAFFPFSYFSSHSPTQPVIAENIQLRPTQRPTEQEVTLSARYLNAGTQVSILGGTDPEAMQPLVFAKADPGGALTSRVKIPAWAERGKEFYLALEQDGKRRGLASFNVVVLEGQLPINAITPGGEVRLPK